ncbi:MAPEG family protein [Gloeobacter morelensis]|uniref:MAPEG family protein n=1 Tax=Gloeobacter morelensis MG652769 TaxID=2781736 RepID=A0ABY3PNP2_9CYAN|nr:MAPEG family protein [Gloeobacter morelensis]UFP95244.1 MAPEG family protein [Gloeobacter morelensis MG652769]
MSALDTLVWPGLVTVAALVVYYGLSLNVGRARVRYGVAPPKTHGSPDFERVLRVQENTTEQMVLFLPSLWLYALFVNPLWAAVLGSVWIVGRVLYALGYYEAPERRSPGFAVSAVATLILLGGALVGLLRRLVLP